MYRICRRPLQVEVTDPLLHLTTQLANFLQKAFILGLLSVLVWTRPGKRLGKLEHVTCSIRQNESIPYTF